MGSLWSAFAAVPMTSCPDAAWAGASASSAASRRIRFMRKGLPARARPHSGLGRADPHRGGEQAGVADDVLPRHRRAAEVLDRADPVEPAAAQLDALQPHAVELDAAEVAALEAHVAQDRLGE